MTREAWVNEASGGVREQAQATQRRLSLKARSDVVTQGHQLIGGTQHKLTGVQHEGIIRSHVHTVGQVRLIGSGIDHRIAVIIEEAEESIQTHVDTCGLNQRAIKRIQLNTSTIKAC